MRKDVGDGRIVLAIILSIQFREAEDAINGKDSAGCWACAVQWHVEIAFAQRAERRRDTEQFCERRENGGLSRPVVTDNGRDVFPELDGHRVRTKTPEIRDGDLLYFHWTSSARRYDVCRF